MDFQVFMTIFVSKISRRGGYRSQAYRLKRLQIGRIIDLYRADGELIG